MSGLESMSALSEANMETEMRQRMQAPELWRRLELYRLASSTSKEDSEKQTRLAVDLLKDIEPRLLFLALDYSHQQQQQPGGELKRRAVEAVIISVFGSAVGPRLLQDNAEVVPFFLSGLCHPVAGVKALTLKTFVVLGRSEAEGRAERCRILLQPPILPALVAVLGDHDTGVAQAAADALVILCDAVSSEAGSFADGDIDCRRESLRSLASQRDQAVAGLTERQAATPKLRFADTAARLMSTSEEAFSTAVDVGALSLVTDLTQDSSDVLLQLNALELLEQVASTVAGARYLIANSHLVGLLVAAGGGGGESPAPPDPLLGASALRTLAKVLAKAARAGLNVWREVDPALRDGYVRACTAHVEGRDEAGKLAGFVAVSAVAEVSNEALKMLLSQEHGTEGVLDAWLTLAGHKVEVKAAALHAVASVLGAPIVSPLAEDEVMGNTMAADDRHERSSLAKQLFERLGTCNRQSAGALVSGLARQPVPEIRHAALDVLRCTVWQPGGWGLTSAFSQPGFRDFLEDRDAQVSKATKEWKFSVMEAIMRCKERGMLGEDMLESFRNHLKQGPFWVPSKTREVTALE